MTQKKITMKKYKVYSKAGGYNFDKIIECDQFSYSTAGAYHFNNTETGQEWWFPILHTVVERLGNNS